MAFTKNDYKEIFKSSLNIQDEQVTDQLKYNDIEEWDSIGHMSLVSAIEDKFKISLETDDIMILALIKKE